MLAYRDNQITLVPLEPAIRRLKSAPPDPYVIGVARDLGILLAGNED